MVANLAPRKMKFGVSEDMVLAASDSESGPYLLAIDEGAQPGMKVRYGAVRVRRSFKHPILSNIRKIFPISAPQPVEILLNYSTALRRRTIAPINPRPASSMA